MGAGLDAQEGPRPECLASPKAIVDVMVNLQFTLVETLWKTFWRYNLSQPSEAPPLAV